MKTKLYLFLALSALISIAKAEAQSPEDLCLLELLSESANDDLTVREIKRLCASEIQVMSDEPVQVSDLGQQSIGDMPRGFRSFFTPYKENYILFGAMENKDGSDPFSGKTFDIRFEFGMKFRAFQNREQLEDTPPIYFGYSQKAWWDVAESSAPFREHNYNPEIFWDFREADSLGISESNNLLVDRVGELVDRIGIEHQSNGLAGPQSRSWDRIYAQRSFTFSDKQWSFNLKAWNVINLGNENADITDYLGNVEGKLTYRPSNNFEVNGTVLKGHHTSKYSYRLDLIASLSELSNSKFMLSYYDGFGEALISFNQKTRSLRAGFFIPIAL